VRALILAAGRAVRLGPSGVELPKCLHEVGGRTLLQRMLEALVEVGVREATLVVGHEGAQLRAAVEGFPDAQRPSVTFVENPDYVRGSILSLYAARAGFGVDDLLIMDADVLFPVELLRRLVESEHPNAFLLDPRSEAGGEEMMLVANEGRVRRIARSVAPEPGEVVGEGVGFLKVSRAAQSALEATLGGFVEAGELDRDYEDGIDRFLAETVVGYEPVGDLPWTEIDFPADLERARTEVWPRVAALRTRGSA
jgi:choline kinase